MNRKMTFKVNLLNSLPVARADEDYPCALRARLSRPSRTAFATLAHGFRDPRARLSRPSRAVRVAIEDRARCPRGPCAFRLFCNSQHEVL